MDINDMGNGLASLIFPTIRGVAIQLGGYTILGLVGLLLNPPYHSFDKGE